VKHQPGSREHRQRQRPRLDGYDDGTGYTTAQANIPAVPGGGNGPTNFNFRVEQNKIPEFFGAKSNDTISAADFLTIRGSGQNKSMDGCLDLSPLRQLPSESGTRVVVIHSQLEHGRERQVSLVRLQGPVQARIRHPNKRQINPGRRWRQRQPERQILLLLQNPGTSARRMPEANQGD